MLERHSSPTRAAPVGAAQPRAVRDAPPGDHGPASRRPITLIVSIDTEEDNWAASRDGLTVENIRALPRQHEFLRRLGVRATYFTNYAVAREPWASSVLRGLRDDGGVELAAHLHPWNTPPLVEPFDPRYTMLKNLPAALQRSKIEVLTQSLTDAFGEAPTAFRAGRWGIAPAGIAALLACGYQVDSSVIPYLDWRAVADGPDHRGAPLDPYWTDGVHDVREPAQAGLVEMPASCAFTRRPFPLWNRVYGALEALTFRGFPLAPAARKLGVIRRVGLTPETHSVGDMLAVSRALIASGVRQLHLFWHSPSVMPGLSPFVRSDADLERFYGSIEDYVSALSANADLTFATVSEAAALLAPGSSTRLAT